MARPILVALIVGTLAGTGSSADPPTASNQSAKPAADVKKRDEAQAELRRLAKESGPLAKAGKLVEAVAAGKLAVELREKSTARTRRTLQSGRVGWRRSTKSKLTGPPRHDAARCPRNPRRALRRQRLARCLCAARTGQHRDTRASHSGRETSTRRSSPTTGPGPRF